MIGAGIESDEVLLASESIAAGPAATSSDVFVQRTSDDASLIVAEENIQENVEVCPDLVPPLHMFTPV